EEVLSQWDRQQSTIVQRIMDLTAAPWFMGLFGSAIAGSGISRFIRDALYGGLHPWQALMHLGFILVGVGLFGLARLWMRKKVNTFLEGQKTSVQRASTQEQAVPAI